MPEMLRMPAFQLGHPDALLILVITRDLAPHGHGIALQTIGFPDEF
jgi:hypothetical protein